MRNKRITLCWLAVVLCAMGPAWGDAFTAGGGRLVALQNNDGGWDWPLSDGNRNIGSAHNIVAPVGMGLAQAYGMEAASSVQAALLKAGTYLLLKSPRQIVPEDGYFAAALDGILGGTKYTDHVKNNFFKPLATGTFPYWGEWTVRVDTTWYLGNLRLMRIDQGLPNLGAFDCGMGLHAAQAVGMDTKPWIAATKAALNIVREGEVFDVLGLAGAVLGLASVGENFDPTRGAFSGASSLADLGKILAGYQLATGGFTWISSSMDNGAGNEGVQETAFALLALAQLDSSQYLATITKAAEYLKKSQLPTGGWENFAGDGENNEVTGEALWALAVAEQAKVAEKVD